MEIKTKILLSAFFHDIGKFQQRGISLSERLKHQEYSSAFVNGLFKDELINLLVRNHHIDDIRLSNLSGEKRILAEIVCEADNLASGERNPDPSVKSQQPLESIFSKINYKDENFPTYFQNLSEINFAKYQFPVNKDNIRLDDLENSYKDWWDKYYSEINNVEKNEIETLINISKKYLWCIPSSSYKTRSDVSLFEHSKITSALAISMYEYLNEKYEKLENISIKDINNRDEERYQLILADITGIQKYIYNISHKGASKALKGRSFYIQQLLDNIAYYILDERLNLPITNLIYSSGGKFYLLAPNTENVNNSLESIEKLLEERFFEEYNGDLNVILGKITLSGTDLQYDNNKQEHLISEKWDKLNKIVESNKKHQFSNNWNYNFFRPTGASGNVELCIATGNELVDKSAILQSTPVKENITNNISFNKYSVGKKNIYEIIDNDEKPTKTFISEEQFIAQKIGADLRNNLNTIIYSEQISDYSVLNLNSFRIQKDFELENRYNAKHLRQLLINDTNILKLKGESEKGFKFYGGDWRLPDTYEEVITKGKGIDRLGVLRLDVDNLGSIFKDGLGTKATFGRVVQLSSMMDFFFSYYINKLRTMNWSIIEGIVIEKPKNNDKLKVSDLMEIVYSGGDDVFIVGHWSILPDVALWINNEFKKFTCNNPNFSISGGIYLFDDKYPIYKAALEAGKFESIAKKKERKNRQDQVLKYKDGICFLDNNTPVSWSDFKIISEYAKTLYLWLENGKPDEEGVSKKISKGLLTRLYSIYEEYETSKYQNWARWRWRAAYSISRLGRQYKQFQKELNEFSSQLFTSDSTEQELINLLKILATWTDLLTRHKEG